MAAACTPTPTLTTTDVTNSQSLITTVSVTTSTLPGSLSTRVFRTCVPTGNVTSPCPFTITTQTLTLPGSTEILTVPVTVPVDVPITQIVTLFGSSCSSPVTTPPSDPTTSVPSSTSSSLFVSTPTTPLFTLSVPDPTTFTTSETITSDGQTYLTTFASTSTQPPTSVLVQPTATGISGADTTNHAHKKSNNAGPIVGGVIGGIAVLLLLGFITLKLIKKQSGFDNIFNDHDQNKTAPFKKTPESKPYNYNPVGQQNTNPTGITPPSSPPPVQGTLNNVGYQPTQAQGPAPQPPQHIRNPSLTPLLAGLGAAAAADAAANVATLNASRPSTAGSQQNLGPQVQPSLQPQGYPPPTSYPPSQQTWNPAQLYGPTGSEGGYSSGTTNATGYAPGLSMQGAGPGTGLAHNPSAGSVGSVPSTWSTSSWGAPSSGSAGIGNVGIPPIMPVLVGASSRQNNNQHQMHQQPLQQYEDPFARSGSPVSIQEQRILQVTNAGPSSPTFQSSSSGRQSYASQQHQASSYYVTNQSQAESSSSGTALAGSSGAYSSGSGSQGTSASGPARDGKGRPLDFKGEKAPIVHLDGGLYQEPVPGAELPAGSAPPAYQM